MKWAGWFDFGVIYPILIFQNSNWSQIGIYKPIPTLEKKKKEERQKPRTSEKHYLTCHSKVELN